MLNSPEIIVTILAFSVIIFAALKLFIRVINVERTNNRASTKSKDSN